MNQAERDRLVALKKAKKKLITQKQAAEEIGVTERQVRRLLRKLRRKGDRAVIHELRGRASNRKLPAEMEQRAITILSDPVYRGFGPTLAAEYLHKRHQITVSKETLRHWMAKAGLWRAGQRRVVEVHQWRPRRSRCGELVQWDTSTHDWLEGRGERIYLISMIDDATSRLFARFVRHDSSEENRRLLWAYLERFGRPLAFYTDKAGMFQVAVKTKRQEQREGRDRPEMPPTQIERALARAERGLDSGALAAGQGPRRAPVFDGAGPPGERAAGGRGAHHRGGQCLPGERISALVEPDPGGAAGRCCRRPSAVGQRARSGGDPEPRRTAAGDQ